MKRILILTAGYGEGHNSAARGVRDGLARIAPDTPVEMHDLFIETYGFLNELVRKGYLGLIDRWPRSWGYVYRWLDCKKDFAGDFRKFHRLKRQLAELLGRFQPDAVVSVFPAYPYLLQEIAGPNRTFKNVIVVTDSITINAIWFQCLADYFLVPNEQSAEIMRAAGVSPAITKVFGFPVSPRFADALHEDAASATSKKRVLYIINPPTLRAIELIRRLLDLDIELTVTVGRNEKLRRAVESISALPATASPARSASHSDAGGQSDAGVANRRLRIFGWTDQLPRLMRTNHLLIGKAGGATVQEAIASACPMIVNHVVSGQEEGNARLIVQTNCGALARSVEEAVAEVQRAFADDAKQWRIWKENIARMSRPRASLDIAEFLLGI